MLFLSGVLLFCFLFFFDNNDMMVTRQIVGYCIAGSVVIVCISLYISLCVLSTTR